MRIPGRVLENVLVGWRRLSSPGASVIWLFNGFETTDERNNNLRLLASLDGQWLKFRYHRGQVPDEILDDPERIKGERVVVAFAFDSVRDGEYSFYPIRTGRVTIPDPTGERFDVIIETGDRWVDYGSRESYDDVVRQLHQRPGTGGTGDWIADDEDGRVWKNVETAPSTGWDRVIETIKGTAELQNTIFYRIVRVKDAENNELDVSEVGSNDWDRGFVFESNETYTVTVQFVSNVGEEKRADAERSEFVVDATDQLTTFFPDESGLDLWNTDRDYEILTGDLSKHGRNQFKTKLDAHGDISGPELTFDVAGTGSLLRVVPYLLIALGIFVASGAVQYALTDNLEMLGATSAGTALTTVGIWWLSRPE